jgi:hypothetical protein
MPHVIFAGYRGQQFIQGNGLHCRRNAMTGDIEQIETDVIFVKLEKPKNISSHKTAGTKYPVKP